MKIYYVTGLFLFFSCTIDAQVVFPLQKGNIWQYSSGNVLDPDMPLEVKIVGDTILTNGKQYSILTGITFGTNLLRQEGSTVYAYDNTDLAEYILLDFVAHENDTLSRHSMGKRVVVAGGKHMFPNTTISYWKFYELMVTGPSGYIFYNWTIQDSIGLTSLTIEPGNSWNLSGAIVNGKLIGTITGAIEETQNIPLKPYLKQNYPNPFNPTTKIEFILPIASFTTLKIFDVLGREVITLLADKLQAGQYSQEWNASNYSSGVYLYTLQSDNYKETKKLLLYK